MARVDTFPVPFNGLFLSNYATLKEKGMAINEISPAEQKRLREAVKPVYEKHATTIGKETVDRMNASLAKVRGG